MYLLRTGKLNRKEREVMLLKDRRKFGAANLLLKPPACSSQPAPLAAAKQGTADTYEARLEEAEARGLGGVDHAQQLRRLIRAREADEAAAHTQLSSSPAAAELLAQMRAQMAR
uniref:Uncharacterized protein n=1 Tax=Haptolina brevifila TaxID=156173 RepID=A0A7S2JAL3_9EUKA|mmetsp:Transcript_78654/g.156375  ORF Transcript_78654/g.156375 Transcript_78654/m.156375 type:complete len:114 (+) Transcript_78654:2-343(+)